MYRSFFWFSDQEMEISERSHRKLLATLRAGDAERAELLMKEHIYEGRDFLIARFGTGAPTKRSKRRARAEPAHREPVGSATCPRAPWLAELTGPSVDRRRRAPGLTMGFRRRDTP